MSESKGGDAASEGGSTKSCPASMDTWFRARYWVSIKLVEARGLRAFDATTQSSDPYAKLRLTVPGEKAPAFEHRTRTIYRNLNPMFAESLICPLSCLRPDCLFELKMSDADWLRNEAMGHVRSTLGDLLRPLESGESPNLVWMNLTRKHGSLWRKPEGEVLLEVSVLPAENASKALAAQEQFLQQEEAATRYQDCQLEVLLHGISFQSALTSPAIANFAKKLLVEVRVGQSTTLHQVNFKVVDDDDRAEDFDLEFDDVVTVPLTAAFQRSQTTGWPNSAQRAGITSDMTDARVILHHDGNMISKTQIPLCCIPFIGDAHVAPSGSTPEPSHHSLKPSHSRKNLSTTSISSMKSIKYGDTGSLVIKEEGEPEDSPTTFVRTMEPLARRSPFGAATIEFTAAFVKKAGPPSSSTWGPDLREESQVLDMLEDQEDMRDAPPLEDIPPPLDFPCLDMEFGFGPCRLYQMLLKVNSKMHAKIAAIQGLSNLNIGPWELVSTDEGKVRQRRITYRKPVNIPVPFAPKHADMIVIQTINRKEVSGWILTVENFTTAPMGDTFKVVVQVLGTRGKTSGSSVLRVSMKVEFLKNPGMLRSVILSQSQKESVDHWTLVRKVMKEAFREEESGQTEASLASQSQEAPAAAEPTPAPAVEARKPTVLQLLSWQTVVLLLGLLLLALLVLSVHEHAQAVRSLATSISQLAAHQAAAPQQEHHEQP